MNTSSLHLPRFGLRSALATVALFAAALQASAAPELVLRETFENTVNGTALSAVGWQSYYDGGSITAPGNGALLSNSIGNNSESLINVGTGTDSTFPGGVLEKRGFAFISTTAKLTTLSFSEVSANDIGAPLTAANLASISFYQGSAGAVDFSAALRIDGSWYVSTLTAGTQVSSAANFATQATALSVTDFSSANWQALNFDLSGATASISLGTVNQSLAEGEITAFGVFASKASGTTVRFDTFEISTIPEPSTYAALVGGLVLVGAALRRRRRA